MNHVKTIRMKRAHWKAWDALLNSGKFIQGRGRLCTETRISLAYCCLGILQIAIDGKIEDKKYVVPTMEWLDRNDITFLSSDGPAPEKTNNPYLPKIGRTAASANDNFFTFEEIAKAIKDTVEFTD